MINLFIVYILSIIYINNNIIITIYKYNYIYYIVYALRCQVLSLLLKRTSFAHLPIDKYEIPCYNIKYSDNLFVGMDRVAPEKTDSDSPSNTFFGNNYGSYYE